MADIAHANRIEPLSGRVGGAPGVTLTPAGAAYRVSLRVDPSEAKTLSRKLGLELPITPKTSVYNGKGRLAAWLGPDEWLLIDENADPLKDLEKVTTLLSAVDISHRQGRAGDGAKRLSAEPERQGLSGWRGHAHGDGQDRGGDHPHRRGRVQGRMLAFVFRLRVHAAVGSGWGLPGLIAG